MTRTRVQCTPLLDDQGRALGFAHGRGPISEGDRAAIARFQQILRDAYQEEQAMAQPDQAPPSSEQPKDVDLVAAGVSGWYFVLEQIAAKRAQLDEAEDHAKEQIKTALGDKVDGTIDGRPVVRWLHTAAPKRFNKKAFENDHADLARQYTTYGEPGRRFELVKPKADAP